jgi:hypothetical protein
VSSQVQRAGSCENDGKTDVIYTRVEGGCSKRNLPPCSIHRPHHQLLYVNKNKELTLNFYDADQEVGVQTGQCGLLYINGLTLNFCDADVLQVHGVP